MNNRDELAEMFAVALVRADTDWSVSPIAAAFNLADAFVAERERRAGTPAEPDAPTGGGVDVMCATPGGDPSDCERPAIHVDVSPSGDMRVPCCGRASCCIKPDNRWTIAPLAPEKPSYQCDPARTRACENEHARCALCPRKGQPNTATVEEATGKPPVAPHDPERGCAGCHGLQCQPHYGAPDSFTCMIRPATLGATPPLPAPSWCPKREKPEGLRFSDDGDLLNADGTDTTDTLAEGYAAYRDDKECAVYIRATDRAHAERIVAAMLPVGRGVK